MLEMLYNLGYGFFMSVFGWVGYIGGLVFVTWAVFLVIHAVGSWLSGLFKNEIKRIDE